MQLFLGAFKGFGLADFDRIRYATIWKPRRWAWVDPLKDIEASIAAVEAKMSTRTREISDHYSEDFEETIDEWAEEDAYIRSQGLGTTLAETPTYADPAFARGDPGDAIIAGSKPALAAQAASEGNGITPATPALPAPQHHSYLQPRAGGRFAGPPAKPKSEPINGEVEPIILQMPEIKVSPNITIERRRGKVTKQITMDDPRTGIKRTATVVETE